MEHSHMKSFTEGSPARLLIGFMVPLLVGLLFQQFYYMVDTMVVGKLLGADALAGVGSTGAINFLVLGFCMGICSGFAIPVAQKFGQQDFVGLRRIVGNILWLGIAFSILITVPVSLLCSRILRWMHTPEATFHYAYSYILVVFLGIPSAMLYNLLSGIIRSLGDSRTPLWFLIFSSLLNVVLDIVLILIFRVGVVGAAIGTVVSQLVSGLLCFVFMLRRFPVLRLGRDDLRPRLQESLLLLAMGVPMGLQYSITAIGNTILQVSVNNLGPAAMAATAAGGRVVGLLACPTDAIGTAAATYAGQNVGAGRLDRVHGGTRANFCIGAVYSVLALGIVACAGRSLVALFLNPADPQSAHMVDLSQQYLLINALFLVPLLCVNLFRFSIQGMGFSGLAMISGVLELIARGGLGLVLVPRFGFPAVCFAGPAAWVMADLFLIPMYFIGLRMLKARYADNPPRP